MKLSKMPISEFQDLIIFVDKTVLCKTKFPHPIGLLAYNDEVVNSLWNIRSGLNVKIRKSRLEPVLTEKFLPYFVIKWCKERGYLTNL
jgi:hypothetical protein